MKFEDIKEGQYLYYTERGVGPFKGGSPDYADSLVQIRRVGGKLKEFRLCVNYEGAYRNDNDEFGGELEPRSFNPKCWSVVDFPGGDAAAWMSQNYPLDGRAHE
jgi:hypothetical protein